MASQTFYPNGGIYPYAKLKYLRYDGNTGGKPFLRPGHFFNASGTTTFEHDTLIIKIKCRNESLAQTNNGWLTFSLYNPGASPKFFYEAAELINNYDSETNKLDIFTYYTVPNNTSFDYAEAHHIYLENINSADILNKDIEFTFKFTVNSKATYDDLPSWDVNISGKIDNNEITPIVLENIPLRIKVDKSPDASINNDQVLSSIPGKIGKLYSIEFSTITNSVETLISKFTPCYQKTSVQSLTKIVLFNELYIKPSTGTNDWQYSAMTLYYFSQFGNMIDYNSITYNLQSSDIQWYNWRTSVRNGIIIP